MKKWKNLFFYIRMVKKHRRDILNYFLLERTDLPYKIVNIEIDRIYRMYTVLNFSPILTNDKIYGSKSLMEDEVRTFIREMQFQFKKYGIDELVGLTRADKVGDNSIWIVIEYKFLNTRKIANNLIIFGILSLITLILLLIF